MGHHRRKEASHPPKHAAGLGAEEDQRWLEAALQARYPRARCVMARTDLRAPLAAARAAGGEHGGGAGGWAMVLISGTGPSISLLSVSY